MSDELKIELQVESNTTKAEEQLDDLIKKYNNCEYITIHNLLYFGLLSRILYI